MDAAGDALPRLQAVAPLNDPFVGDGELAEAVKVALLLRKGEGRKEGDICIVDHAAARSHLMPGCPETILLSRSRTAPFFCNFHFMSAPHRRIDS